MKITGVIPLVVESLRQVHRLNFAVPIKVHFRPLFCTSWAMEAQVFFRVSLVVQDKEDTGHGVQKSRSIHRYT